MLCREGKSRCLLRMEEIGVGEGLVVRGRAWPCVKGLLPSEEYICWWVQTRWWHSCGSLWIV